MSIRIRAGSHPDVNKPEVARAAFEQPTPDPEQPQLGAFLRPGRDRFAMLREVAVSRVIAGGLVVALVVAVVGGLAYRLSVPAPTSHLPVAAEAPAPIDAVPTPSVTVTTPAPVNDTSAVSWQGAAMPVSYADGPFEFSKTRSSGFTQTPLGAALAAVHVSTHMDPFTGPAVFTDTINDQVIGDTHALLRETSKAYRTAAAAHAVPSGEPVIAPTGSMSDWRIKNYRAHQRNDVQLLVQTPTGDEVVYIVPVKWEGGDWKVDLTDAAPGKTFSTVAVKNAGSFEPFIKQITNSGGTHE